MALILRVITYKGDPPAQAMSTQFDEQGGSIGRAPENLMVLPDPEKFVSRRHACILLEKGEYFIEDSSSGGTYLVSQDVLLQQSRAALAEGETVRIGEYVLQVAISENTPVAFMPVAEPVRRLELVELGLSGDPFNTLETPAVSADFYSSFMGQAESSAFHQSFVMPEVAAPAVTAGNDDLALADLLSTLDSLSSNPAPSSPELPELPEDFFVESADKDDSLSSETATDEPAVDREQAALISPFNNFFPEREEADAPVSFIAEQPPVSSTVSHADVALLQAFLAGVGLTDTLDLPPEQWPSLMKTAGELLRELLDGLMQVLRARAELKSQWRVSFTTLRPLDNNPLKFTPQVGDALKLMLSPSHSGFLAPQAAVRESFEDLMQHQLAMTAGIQAALDDSLHRFDPVLLEKSLGDGGLFQKKAKCWERYTKQYPHLKASAQAAFFGEAFAEAYEKQMQLLGRSAKKP